MRPGHEELDDVLSRAFCVAWRRFVNLLGAPVGRPGLISVGQAAYSGMCVAERESAAVRPAPDSDVAAGRSVLPLRI